MLRMHFVDWRRPNPGIPDRVKTAPIETTHRRKDRRNIKTHCNRPSEALRQLQQQHIVSGHLNALRCRGRQLNMSAAIAEYQASDSS